MALGDSRPTVAKDVKANHLARWIDKPDRSVCVVSSREGSIELFEVVALIDYSTHCAWVLDRVFSIPHNAGDSIEIMKRKSVEELSKMGLCVEVAI